MRRSRSASCYAHTLRAAGHRVIIPKDSGAVYQIATTRPPDIVVTDVRITGSISGRILTVSTINCPANALTRLVPVRALRLI